MKNKKKITEAFLKIAEHMSKCEACIESLFEAGTYKADPTCDEYQRLKAIAKSLAPPKLVD